MAALIQPSPKSCSSRCHLEIETQRHRESKPLALSHIASKGQSLVSYTSLPNTNALTSAPHCLFFPSPSSSRPFEG